jgi:1-acyl-sn-glycerol-3-phosphate acyltransferase
VSAVEPASPAAPLSPRRTSLPDVRFSPRLFRAASAVLRAVLRLILDMRVRGWEHVPSSGAALIAGNHRGFLDGPMVAIFSPRPVRCLAKSELFRGRAARPLILAGQIPVDRGRADREALRAGLAVLQGGDCLGVFPEGTRGSGTLETVQHGIAWFVLRAPDTPIVPVACLGTEQALPKGARLPRWRTRVDVVFGPPFTVTVPANPRARSALADVAEQIRVRLADHVRSVERDRVGT